MGIPASVVRGLNWGLISAATKRALTKARRFESHIATALLGGQYRATPDGVIVLDDFRLTGEYFTRVRERESDFQVDHNLLVDQGILKMLGVTLYTDTKIPSWYIALHSGTTAPTNTLTAQNYASTMNEITSLTEGYSNATRPVWTPSQPAANVVNNTASQASFSIVTSTSVTIQGGALLSDSARGGTTGTLMSSSKFTNARELFDGETFDVGYQVSLTD